MKTFHALLPIAVLAVACSDLSTKKPALQQNTYSSIEDTLYLPFDTVKVIEMMDITLRVNQIEELGSERIEGLSDNWDTLELTYIAYACSCPNWTLMEEYDRHPESKTSMEFPYGYYIEPASPSLRVNEWLYCPTVRFIGKLYDEKGIPDESPVGPEWPPGKKFRYYAYEVVRPVTAIGPYYHTGEPEIPGDTEELIERSMLIIE
jgi:hypothetical protein